MKTKRITYAALFVFSSSVLFSQSNPTFHSIKLKSNNYFDSIHNYIPDSLFYAEGSEYSEYKRWESIWEKRLQPEGTISQYFEKLESSYIQQRTTTIYNTDWAETGPSDKPANQSAATGIGPIEFIKFFKGSSPTDPRNQNMICGSTAGGLFFTNDVDNIGWVNAGTDKLPFSTASCATFKVDDPEVVYVGVGVWADCEPGYIEQSGGVFRAHKNGPISQNTVWDRIADYNSFGGHTDCRIQKILTDPNNPDILYVATTWGLFKSTNINEANPNNVVWVNIMKDASQQALADNVYDVEMHPGIGNNNILYASFSRYDKFPGHLSQNANLIKYTTDGGSTWYVLDYLPAFSNTEIQFVTLEVSDIFPDNIYIRYMKSKPNGTCCTGNTDLYRYVNLLPTPNSICTLIHSTTQGIFGSGNAFGVSQSGTEEIIFFPYSIGYEILKPGVSTLTFGSRNDIHDDKEGFTFNPFNSTEIWMATHGGIDKSSDGGLTWQSKSKGLGVAHLRSIATSYQNPDDIILGLYHDACVVTNGNNPDGSHYSWERATNAYGDGMRVLIDKNEPQNKYYSNQYWWYKASNSSGTPAFNQISFPQLDFAPKGILNRVETKIMYEISNGEVIRSLDRGNSPYPVISDIKFLNSCTICGVQDIYSSEENSNYLFATFTNNGTNKLYYTDKAADPYISSSADWHEILNLPNGNNIQFVKFDPEHQNTIFVAFYPEWQNSLYVNLVYKIENFASQSPVFIDLTNNLTGMPATALELEKGSDGGLYYACDAGVYYTNNKLLLTPTNSWVLFGNNLPHCRINGMEINYKSNKIRVGLWGRGAWEASLYCPSSGDLTITQNSSPTEFDETKDNIFASANNFIPSDHVTYRAGNQIHLTNGFRTNGAYVHAFIHPCDAPGNSFRSASTNSFVNGAKENDVNKQKISNKNLTISPNPNNGTFKIIITKNSSPIGIKDLKVYDIMGKVIWQTGTSNNNTFDVDISNYAQGIYYVRSINEDGEIEVQKLIKN